MTLYNVEIIEKLSRVVEQEADSYEDAVELVSTKYADGEIVLDWEDLDSTEYEPYPSQEIVEDFNININYNYSNKLLTFRDEYQSIATYDCKSFEDFDIAFEDFFKDFVKLEKIKSKKDIEEDICL